MTDHHDHGHPLSYPNALEVAWLAADSTALLCGHCYATGTMVPMGGPGWALDVTHEQDCPTHEDNNPGSEASPADYPEVNH